jgi:predicted metal-dependent HD superfamily phosphohydrolase
VERRMGIEVDRSFTNLVIDNYIIHSYSNERYYHTIRHLMVMLEDVRQFHLGLIDRTKLEFAIFFHDVVYDVTSNRNEEDSADHFRGFGAALGLEEKDIEEIYWLIRVTTHQGSPQTKLEEIICDMDLKELGTDRYIQNAIEVREEFAALSEQEWIEGRIKFLEFMLSKDTIFHTEEFKEIYEQKARENISNELTKIKNG